MKIFASFFVFIFLLFSCSKSTPENSLEGNGTKIDKSQTNMSSGGENSSFLTGKIQNISSEGTRNTSTGNLKLGKYGIKIKKESFNDNSVTKIDGFFLDYNNSDFLTDDDLEFDDTRNDVEKRAIENLKKEIKGQFLSLLSQANTLLEYKNTQKIKDSDFLSMPDGKKFERLIYILDIMNYPEDFKNVGNYDAKKEYSRFSNLRKTYVLLKESNNSQTQTGSLENNNK